MEDFPQKEAIHIFIGVLCPPFMGVPPWLLIFLIFQHFFQAETYGRSWDDDPQ